MSDGPWITIKNWEKYAPKQRNKTAVMPWLRIYRKLLTDYDYRRLAPQYRALLVDLWLLAAEHGGKVKANVPELAFQLHAEREWISDGLEAIAAFGFIALPGPLANKLSASRAQGDDNLYLEGKGTEGNGTEGKRRDKPASVSWLTPFLAEWQSAFGGVQPSAGRFGKSLSALCKTHGQDKVLRHFSFYLRQSNGKASVEHFAQTFGKWDEAAAPDAQLSTLAGPPETAFYEPPPRRPA